MSRLFEALSWLEAENFQLRAVPPEVPPPAGAQRTTPPNPAGIERAASVCISAPLMSRLVALTEPNNLGAEKFRMLATRLDNLRTQRPLKSVQVTSSGIGEGKTLVATNLALTFAMHSVSRVLLVEGDLHRPTLASLFGLSSLPGLAHWWRELDSELESYLHRLNDMPLWILAAGRAHNRPSDILNSSRFTKAFAQLTAQFEWIVVDSTPMSPVVDASLWSRVVDGTLLVVREGVASLKILKNGVQSFDQPKWVAVVMNEASEFDGADRGSKTSGVSVPQPYGLAGGQ
jgi:capsular exopolysaccharide synthesis family protein